MRGLKYGLRQCMGWAAAAAAAFLVCNALVFFYHHPAGWIERDSSATVAIWKPGSTLRMGTEGCGVYTVDQRGYLNPELPLADNLYAGSGFLLCSGKGSAPGQPLYGSAECGADGLR